MPAPKLNRSWLVAFALLCALLALSLLHHRRTQPRAISSLPALASPAPVMERPVLPPLPATPPTGVPGPAPSAPSAAPLAPETAAWLAQRFPDSRVVAQRATPAA